MKIHISELRKGDIFFEVDGGFAIKFKAVSEPVMTEEGWQIDAVRLDGRRPAILLTLSVVRRKLKQEHLPGSLTEFHTQLGNNRLIDGCCDV